MKCYDSTDLVDLLPKIDEKETKGCSHDTFRPRNSMSTPKTERNISLLPKIWGTPLFWDTDYKAVFDT
jgi:hypothetical protein